MLDLLQLLVRRTAPMAISEAAAELGIHRTVANRLMHSLVSRGFASRDAAGGYRVGTGLLVLAFDVVSKLDVPELARPAMARARSLTGETVSLHLRQGSERVCVATVESEQPVRRVIPLGERLPLHRGPSGKVIIAHQPEAERERLIANAVATGDVNEKDYRKQLAQARRDGYLVTTSDRTAGVGAIAVAVFDASGTAIASLTVSGPEDRWNPKTIAKFRTGLLEEALGISSAFGHQGGEAGNGRDGAMA